MKRIDFRFHKEFLFKLLNLTLTVIGLWVVAILIERSDAAIMEHRCKYQLSFIAPIDLTNDFSNDEQRIAKRFVTDTMPGLMQKGLIKKYERHEFGTSLLVSGKLWKKRSLFFKQSLLTEILIYNEVNGYEVWTQIVDSQSRKLYAQISPSTKIKFYD